MSTGRLGAGDTAIQPTIFDAKGDLLTATAADTAARIAVGNSGETLVADSSTSTGLRWQANQAAGRNTCINGGMDIWQRGTSFVPTNGATTLGPDRWVMYRNGGTGSTVSRQTSGLTNFLYSCRVQRDSGNTSTNAIYIWQNWESQSTYQLAGKTIVISYYARAGANYSPTSSLLGVQLFTGTGVDENIWTGYTGQAQPLDATQAITTTWTRYTQVLTLNSNVTEMCLRFLMTPTGTASTNDWFEVTGIQVELGNVPTTFTRAGGTLAGERSACERYYWKDSSCLYEMFIINTNDNLRRITISNPVTMRGNGSYTITLDSGSATVDNITPRSARVYISKGNTTSSAYITSIEVSAEL